MSMPRNEIQMEMAQAWRDFTTSMEKSLDMLEADINEAEEMAGICTDEWCEATEHVIDELSNALFTISEPRGSSPEDSDKIKALKRRVHDLYANYREVYKKAKG
jgi:hypothetical protein